MKIDVNKYLDSDEDLVGELTSRRARRVLQPRVKRFKQNKRSDHEVRDEILQHIDPDRVGAQGDFDPSFTSSYHEREWILNYLGSFFNEKRITDVLGKVKGGKEANVYCCAAHPDTGLELVAAKVYRPRMFRNLRNDARYRQNRQIYDERGKEVRDPRYLQAIQKGTRKGKELQHTSWLQHEYQTLDMLYNAGADVPKPLAFGNNTILMEYLGEGGLAAPTLNEVALDKVEANRLFPALLRNVELMLAHGCIHADLSAYNVLYWDGVFKIIDFPQAVNPHSNPDALEIFHRDVRRLCQYFRPYGIQVDPDMVASELWQRCGLEEERREM